MDIESIFHREIMQQPAVVGNILQQQAAFQHLADEIQARQIEFVMIAARGTSDNAARYANYLLGANNHLPVALAAPSLFSIYKKPPRLGNSLVIGISQSGKSPDIVSVIAEAQRQGALTAAITNAGDSPLAQAASHVIELLAGEERAVAASKTYTAECTAIAALSACLTGEQQYWQELTRLPEAIQAVLKIEPMIARAAERYRYMRACVVIGRGFNYCTAFETALKLKEMTYTVVEPYSSADFYHGPLAILEPGFPVIIIAPRGDMSPEIHQFVEAIRRYHAEIVVISDDEDLLNQARIPLRLPVHLPEWLSPIAAVIPGQLLALHLALVRDLDPDHPRSLHKVTETI